MHILAMLLQKTFEGLGRARGPSACRCLLQSRWQPTCTCLFPRGGARDVGPLVCPPACAYLSACQPASCPPPPPAHCALPCQVPRPFTSACASGWPACAQLLSRAARQVRCAFCAASLPFRIFMPSRPPLQPALPCHRYFSSVACPCACCCTTWQARSACLPSARLHRLWSFRGSACSMLATSH